MSSPSVTVDREGTVTGNTYDKYGSTNPVVRRLMAAFEAALDELFELAAPRPPPGGGRGGAARRRPAAGCGRGGGGGRPEGGGAPAHRGSRRPDRPRRSAAARGVGE